MCTGGYRRKSNKYVADGLPQITNTSTGEFGIENDILGFANQ